MGDKHSRDGMFGCCRPERHLHWRLPWAVALCEASGDADHNNRVDAAAWAGSKGWDQGQGGMSYARAELCLGNQRLSHGGE